MINGWAIMALAAAVLDIADLALTNHTDRGPGWMWTAAIHPSRSLRRSSARPHDSPVTPAELAADTRRGVRTMTALVAEFPLRVALGARPHRDGINENSSRHGPHPRHVARIKRTGRLAYPPSRRYRGRQ